MAQNFNGNGNGHVSANGHLKAAGNGKKWTVMVYLAGDNNLTPYCVSVLQQLEMIPENDDVRVLACFDSNTPWPKGSRYLEIHNRRRSINNGLNWGMQNDLIPPYARNHKFKPPNFCTTTPRPQGRQLRTGVAEGLKRFIGWAMKKYKNSERYMLILYGHGPLVAGKTFLLQENPQDSLTLDQLKKVLHPHFGPGRRLDILACQNCVMNGLETAYELRDQVETIVGSQGLVLADGWPYDTLMTTVQTHSAVPTKMLCKDLLKVCARHLLDFSIMDQSSEQSVCDVRRLDDKDNITTAVRKLVDALESGLKFHKVKGKKVLRFPVICSAVQLARLEAQSYWGETFVDLYDFCERLMKRCNEAVCESAVLIYQLGLNGRAQANLRKTVLVRRLKTIIYRCMIVMRRIKKMVTSSYYIGSDLQYSHGLSVFFPWTLPGEPYFFVKSGQNYILKTAFETYRKYGFAIESGWADFLQAFYRATLRRVRRTERGFSLRKPTDPIDQGFVNEHYQAVTELLTGDLQKSSSSTGYGDPDVWSNVKNYPRRNYVSPSDCPRKIDNAGRHQAGETKFPTVTDPPVSYLGWNLAGIVADVIRAPAPNRNGRQKTVASRIPANAAAAMTLSSTSR